MRFRPSTNPVLVDGVCQFHGVEEEGIYIKHQLLVDVSHCNLKSFWDIANIATKPFIATHSNTYALSPVARNLVDEQIRTLAEKQCVMGMNGCSFIVNYNAPNDASMDDLIGHLLHEKQVGSAAILAIGLDQADRINEACFAMTGEETFDVIPSHEMIPAFVGKLLDRGFTESEIKGFLGGNALTLLRKTIDQPGF